jgi:hypothetical protein
MAKVNSILNQRLAIKEHKPKMTELAEQSARGQLTSFSGIFGVGGLNETEKEGLKELLNRYSDDALKGSIEPDFRSLVELTSEVKAINNQAAILHGERIKKAQEILKKYQEGAFSTWLINTYGNRQTPYNFLQYYEFYSTLPKALHQQMEAMPRQAIYTLASRKGALEKKIELIREFKGQTKDELLTLIRTLFPLPEKDGRRENLGESIILNLKRLVKTFSREPSPLSLQEKKELLQLLNQLKHDINCRELRES